MNKITSKKLMVVTLCGLVGAVMAAPPHDPKIEELKRDFNQVAVAMNDHSHSLADRARAHQRALEIAQAVASLNVNRYSPSAFRGFVLGDFNTNGVNTNDDIRRALNGLVCRLTPGSDHGWRRIAESYRAVTERELKQLEDLAREGMME